LLGSRENGSNGTSLSSLIARRRGPVARPALGNGHPGATPERSSKVEETILALEAALAGAVSADRRASLSRGELARVITEHVSCYCRDRAVALTPIEHRDTVNALLEGLLAAAAASSSDTRPGEDHRLAVADTPVPPDPAKTENAATSRATVESAKERLQSKIMERMDVAAAAQLPRLELERQLADIVGDLLVESKLHLNLAEQHDLVRMLLDDMLGLGALEPLLADESITDIMVNGPKQVYVERKGKLEITDVRFRDNAHLLNIATRIVTRVGRRVDESSPLCDARLADGSRVNVIVPPLAIDGPSISIRKFSKKSITLDVMSRQANISVQMATVMKVASRSRLNILISGGTGSGKTTLLNAMSRLIDHGERIVTIEDAAELQLQQPHVVRLETRPPNLEGKGEINQRDLVKNALRMRPDRIILGEVRGAEALDMLQAMNTGHDGSMCTVHANRPREALTRIENMVGMAGVNLPSKAVRTQIASAIHMIIQVSRMRDGMRRITHVTEVVGMEGDVIITQDLFTFSFEGEGTDGKLRGSFKSGGVRPHFLPRAEYFGLDRALLEAV
jgi:pilus assembly protein CpaF